MNPALKDLLSRGYFPQELPPPFVTESFALFVDASGIGVFDSRTRPSSLPARFNLARAGSLRRELSILNPVHFSILAEAVCTGWSEIESKLTSPLSLTTPRPNAKGRALSRLNDLDALPDVRAKYRAQGKMILSADVARFYPSVYTHTIPWVLHGKTVAKVQRRNQNLLGNRLDLCLRNCQDGQTIGLPVGPDSSLVMAELLLSEIDRGLAGQGLQGYRYVDDFELIFPDRESALKGRSILQASLQSFELNLGEAKTAVRNLPLPLREQWISELRKFKFKHGLIPNKKRLIAFFDRAFFLAQSNPDQPVLKYAAGRIANHPFLRFEPVAEDLLMQCARVEAGSLGFVLASILRRPSADPDRLRLRSKFLIDLVLEHSPQSHSSEVSWALWAMIVLNIRIPESVGRAIVGMNDCVSSLLILHAREKRLVEKPTLLNELRRGLDGNALYGPNWILAYEAVRQGWLRFSRANNFVRADPNFSQLLDAGVTFYNRDLTLPLPARPFGFPLIHEDEEDDYLSRIVRKYDDDDWDDDEDEDEDTEESDPDWQQ